MKPNLEKILVVESDPDIGDMVVRQALQPLGYQTALATDAGAAIKLAVQASPDLVIANLHLSGLSGKDLLVGLNSQGVNVPFIVISKKGDEESVIQAFRLGASDHITWPARDAEIVAVVERVVKQVRERKARALLDAQLKQTNEELQRRVRELTTMSAIGRAVLSTTDQRVLFEKLVEASVTVTQSDMGWLLVRDDKTRAFVLRAGQKLPDAWARKVGEPLDDGLGGLVALSAETLSINGEPLKKFKAAALGQSAMVAPVKVQNEVIGLLTVLRKVNKAYDKSEQSMLENVADYASISMVNAQLFKALAQTAEAAQAGEKHRMERYEAIRAEMRKQVQTMSFPLDALLTGRAGALTAEQTQALSALRDGLQHMASLTDQQASRPAPHP